MPNLSQLLFSRSKKAFSIIFLSALLSACGGGTGGDTGSTTAPTPPQQNEPTVTTYTITGTITDELEEPISGALVTVDGIEATGLTSNTGEFTVQSTEEFSSDVVVTANQDNYQAFSATISLLSDSEENHFKLSSSVMMSESEPWGFLELQTGAVVTSAARSINSSTNAQSNCDCTIALGGRALKKGRANATLFALLVVDTSGSTGDTSVGNQTVFETEIAAMNALIDSLNGNPGNYVGIIKFAGTAETVLDFTNDLTAAKEALAQIQPEVSGTSNAATNYQAAIELAKATFAAAGGRARDVRSVAFMSDGIPTAPFGSGLTQEAGDRTVAIAAAESIAVDGAMINTFPVNLQSNLSTLPAISAITEGNYYQHQASQISQEIHKDSLVGIVGMEIVNETTQESAINTILRPDGFFYSEVCLSGFEPNLITVSPKVCFDCEDEAYQQINVKCDRPEQQQCGQCAGQVTNLTLQYNGDVNGAEVVVTQRKNANKDYILYSDTINSGEQFEFFGGKRNKTMGAEINVFVDGQLNATFKTNCGQPKIGPGRSEGDFTVVEGYSRNGGLLCPIE